MSGVKGKSGIGSGGAGKGQGRPKNDPNAPPKKSRTFSLTDYQHEKVKEFIKKLRNPAE